MSYMEVSVWELHGGSVIERQHTFDSVEHTDREFCGTCEIDEATTDLLENDSRMDPGQVALFFQVFVCARALDYTVVGDVTAAQAGGNVSHQDGLFAFP